jgi:hypothetical protein
MNNRRSSSGAPPGLAGPPGPPGSIATPQGAASVPLNAYEAMAAEGAAPRHAARVAAMKQDFVSRTGAFGPEDSWFEARSRAFWDDALTHLGFAREVECAIAEELRTWVAPFERAHRGLFRATRAGNVRVLVDVWSGAEFVLHSAEEGVRDALDAATGLFDARLVACDEPLCIAMLPGAVFHSDDASEPIARLLDIAHTSKLATRVVLDGLLKMEHSLRALSRVKPAYAYRRELFAKLAAD